MQFAVGSPPQQARGKSPPMPGLHRVVFSSVIFLFVFPLEIQPTVNMVSYCGHTIHSAGDMIFSQGGMHYPPNINCTITIATLDGEGYVLLQIRELNLKSNNACTDDYLELRNVKARDENGEDVTSQRLCGGADDIIPREVASRGAYLQVHMATDGSQQGRGWAGVFTTVLTDFSLCMSYDRYRCKNGRCIPSSLKCDSVDHCGDNSDELTHCEDDLPTYLGDRILEHKEFIYIGLAVVFTGIFALYFGIVCTKDSVKKMRQRVKKAMTKCKQKTEPVELTAEEELRQVLMTKRNNSFDRRVSQPYDTTLNTITGGELAKQLKFELRKFRDSDTDANNSNQSQSKHHYHHINLHMPHIHQQSDNYMKVTSASDTISLLDHEIDITANDVKNPMRKESSTSAAVHSKVTPSVVVSDHNGNGTEVVLLSHQNFPSIGSAPGASSTDDTKQVSRFQVTAITEDNPPQTPVSVHRAPTMQTPASKSKPWFGVSKASEKRSKDGTPSQPKSKFGFKPKDYKKHKAKTKSTDFSDGGRNRADSNPINEPEVLGSSYLAVPSRHTVISSQTDSSSTIKKSKGRFSVQHNEESEKTCESSRETPKTDPLNVQEMSNSNKPERAESTLVTKPTPSRFTVQKVDDASSAADEKRKAFLEKLERQTPKAVKGKGKTMARHNSEPDTSSPLKQRLSTSATDETISEHDLPKTSQTFHAFTQIKWWDEDKGKYSFVTSL